MSSSSSGPAQLPLDLALRPAFGAEDFFLSQSNEMAVKLIDDWPDWPQYGHVLTGPPASGKSHLVNVWRLRSNATIIAASELQLASLRELREHQQVCIEDIDRGLASEDALFHLLNLMDEKKGEVLLSTRTSIPDIPIKLKDLRSRLTALPGVSINTPDDHLLKLVMIKQFADRQIEVEPRLVEYLMKRTERSMLAVNRLVEELDRGSIGTGRRITRQLAGEILSRDQH